MYCDVCGSLLQEVVMVVIDFKKMKIPIYVCVSCKTWFPKKSEKWDKVIYHSCNFN